ncbi:hypothetical protein L3X38_032273 [Prunus dulcis]|uniref:Reverse transcriptase domain-containing protein n=1 Tax=Prunus dulcis TaxID=3755 RepID=A0AAD4VET7_PRUDU|nr:hypothetical protein L3X38_032273 [Prunus dulcis]
MQPDSATNTSAAFGAFKSSLRESNFRYLVHSNNWNTYAELMKQAAVHANAEYFNSKHGPATPARSIFSDPPPASVPTPTPPQHSASAPSTQGTLHPKRKDSYQHTFSNNKRGKHGNHHQSSGSNPPRTSDRASLSFTPKPMFKKASSVRQAGSSFITDRGLYCYKVMLFDLKNAGATYQRLVNSFFAPLIGNTMEVYVDDMLVKSRTAD